MARLVSDDDFESDSDDTVLVPDGDISHAVSDGNDTTGSIKALDEDSKADTDLKNVYVIYFGSGAASDNNVDSKNVSEDDSNSDGSKNLYLLAIYIVLGVLFLVFLNLAVSCTTSNIVDAVM